MFRRILVPLDGSRAAEGALPLARGLSQTSGGSLLLVRVAPLTADAATLQSIQTYLSHRAQDAEAEAAGVLVETYIVSDEPARGIVAATQEHAADLVVMVTHGRREPELLVRGSVSAHVVRASPVPVLIVRDGASERQTDPRQPTILVPLDGSALSESALPVAKLFARQLNGHLLLVRAVEVPALMLDMSVVTPVDVSGDLAVLATEADAYLTSLASRLRAEGYRVRYLVDTAPAAAAVLRAEHRAHPALVVMATHAREGLARLLFGSVTGSVVHDGHTPVVVVPDAHVRP